MPYRVESASDKVDGMRKPLDLQAFGLMLIVCASLGLQQVALKATAGDVSPVLLIAMRSGIAAVLVGLYMLAPRLRSGLRRKAGAIGGDPVADGGWKPGLLVGFLFTLEYLLLGEALRLTSAAHAVVFLYTAPVFAALILHITVPAERMSLRQWVGILMAFAGVATAFLGQRAGADRAAADMLAGDLLALLAGAAWGLTTVVVRGSRLSRVPATQTLLYQLTAACLLLLVAAALLDQMTFRPTAMVLANLGFQSVVVSFLAFLIWFGLLRRYVASRLGVLSFMTPLFGVLFGVWLLDEPMEPGFVTGAMLVLAGMTVVGSAGWSGRAGLIGWTLRSGQAEYRGTDRGDEAREQAQRGDGEAGRLAQAGQGGRAAQPSEAQRGRGDGGHGAEAKPRHHRQAAFGAAGHHGIEQCAINHAAGHAAPGEP